MSTTTLASFKETLGRQLKNIPGSEMLKTQYKAKLFREIVNSSDYKELKKEDLSRRRIQKEKEKKITNLFNEAKSINPNLNKEDFFQTIEEGRRVVIYSGGGGSGRRPGRTYK